MSNIDEIIQGYLNGSELSRSSVLEQVKCLYKNIKLSDKTLGMLFEAYVEEVGWEDEEEYISPDIKLSDLMEINSYFKTTNGNQWARTDASFLGKKYNIERTLKGGKTYSIKLNGLNNGIQKNRSIRTDIVKAISKQRCAILDIGTNIEVDHKNGRYNDENVANTETQKLEDFQPLCKTANDAKRHHCKECISKSERYDATRLGYKEGWIKGDIDTSNCIGCYWYDPHEFNKNISKDFKKEDEGN